jgi:uncharacterized protein (TIGR02246 family)
MAVSAQDYAELQQLCARYSQSADAGDADAFAGCFAADGALVIGGDAVEGREAIRERTRTNAAATQPTGFHVPGGIVAEVQGDRGTMRSYLIHHNGAAPAQVLSVVYEDELVREDGAWRFARRTVAEIKGVPAA